MDESKTKRFREIIASHFANFTNARQLDVNEIVEALDKVLQEYQVSSQENTLTPRERLIQRAFEISDFEIEAVLDYIDQLEDLADIAVSQSRKDEVGVPLDDVLKRHGFTREELMAESETEDMPQ